MANGQQPGNQQQAAKSKVDWTEILKEVYRLIRLLAELKGAAPATVILAACAALVFIAKQNSSAWMIAAAILFLAVGIGWFVIAARKAVIVKFLNRHQGDGQAADMVARATEAICDTTWGPPSKQPGGSEFDRYSKERERAIKRGLSYRLISSCSKSKDGGLPNEACKKECAYLRKLAHDHDNFKWKQLKEGPLPTAPEVLIADPDQVLLGFSDIAGAPSLFFQETEIATIFRSYFDEAFSKAHPPYSRCPHER